MVAAVVARVQRRQATAVSKMRMLFLFQSRDIKYIFSYKVENVKIVDLT